MEPNHFAHALAVRVEGRMAEEVADGGGDLSLVFADVLEHQAIHGVRQARIPEVLVTGEKRRAL